jgi:hypothetical protein
VWDDPTPLLICLRTLFCCCGTAARLLQTRHPTWQLLRYSDADSMGVVALLQNYRVMADSSQEGGCGIIPHRDGRGAWHC